MKLYILHYATIDEDGHLSIDCRGPFQTFDEAHNRQLSIISDFLNSNAFLSSEQIEEKCGSFYRMAYKEHLSELQSHIEEMKLLS
ncbi:MAG: hypothetical protein IJO34_05870 [Akkermansia sp.]|nr:hypothetical protein [Akkermansia sp.]